MSQIFNAQRSNTAADQIYFDVTATNFGTTAATPPPTFYYNESRALPFIEKPEDYYLSIMRFTVETGNLPVFIPLIQNDTTINTTKDPNYTVYAVTLRLTYPDSTVFDSGGLLNREGYTTCPIVWKCPDATIPTPAFTSSFPDNTNGYYNCYSFQHLINLINTAILNCYLEQPNSPYAKSKNVSSTTSAAIGGVSARWSKGNQFVYNAPNSAPLCPQLVWNNVTQKVSVYADVNWFANFPGQYNLSIEFNPALYQLFNSFPAKKTIYNTYALDFGWNNVATTNLSSYSSIVMGAPTSFVPQSNGLGIYPQQSNGLPLYNPAQQKPITTTYPALVLEQEYPTVFNISPITSIVFCSNTLPVEPNLVSTPLFYNYNYKESGYKGLNADIANIITDLTSNDGNYRPFLVYLPSAQYRYITLRGNRPLYNLDLSVYYRTKYGQLVPFTIQSGASITIKLAFIKKSSVNQMEKL